MSYGQYKGMKENVVLERTSVKIYAFQNKTPIELIGSFESYVTHNGKSVMATFYVTSMDQTTSLLSYDTAVNLGIINIIHHASELGIESKFK